MKELTVIANPENLGQVIAFVGSEDMQTDVAIEEIFINICIYAYADSGGAGDVTVRVEQTGDMLTIEFTDSGMPYNPLSQARPDDLAAETSAEKNVGGYGIYMTRLLTDSLSYRYEDGKNILTMTRSAYGAS